MRGGSFQTKLLSLMIVGLLLLQGATLVVVHVAGQRTLREMVAEELRVGGRVLNRVLLARGQQLSDAVRVLAADFGFREAIASEDRPTITSVLNNHGARLDADAAFLMRLDGSVAADTLGGRFTGRPFPYADLLAKALAAGEVSALVSFEDRPYQFVLVPVLAPDAIAAVCIGFAVDEALLAEVSRLTSLDISLWSSTPGRRASLLSTLSPRFQGELLEQVAQLSADSAPFTRTMTFGAETYETLWQGLDTAGGATVQTLLKRSLEEAGRPFRRLELQIFALSSAALLAAVVLAVLLARGVSRPLRLLATGARRIARGDYGTAVEIDRDDEFGMLATAFNRMGTGIGEREDRIRFQATHDVLTGLPNRVLFLDRLSHEIDIAKRRGSLVGMLMMDLDRFKEVNDTIGHHFGDELLIEVGRRLRHATRDADTVARLGGDEFAVTFETRDPSQAIEIAQRTARALEEPFTLGGVSIDVKASIGIALYPLHAEDSGALMKCADVAMYDAKRGHQSYSVYELARDEHSLRRLAILSELRHAITGDQLELEYQPEIDIVAGRAVHAEALVRWRHPIYGIVPPDEFIPLAEHSGSIGRLTEWVLRRAVADCASWRRSGHDLTVAVNLSALDLYDPELPDRVQRLLDEQELEPSKLVLEITESAVMKDASHAAKTLQVLKDCGIVLAIDDFGTGYSSLAHLKRLPVDKLKIDRSFVAKLGEEANEDSIIVRSTIELGHNMGLRVVAEGVANEAGWQVLERLRCDLAQGYFISRPLPNEELLAWVKESRWGSGQRL